MIIPGLLVTRRPFLEGTSRAKRDEGDEDEDDPGAQGYGQARAAHLGEGASAQQEQPLHRHEQGAGDAEGAAAQVRRDGLDVGGVGDELQGVARPRPRPTGPRAP
jgi:hypothetical protein